MCISCPFLGAKKNVELFTMIKKVISFEKDITEFGLTKKQFLSLVEDLPDDHLKIHPGEMFFQGRRLYKALGY